MYFLDPGTHHRVPIYTMLDDKKAVKIDPRLIPDQETAVREFEAHGGQLTMFSSFGEDPLQGNPSLVAQREAEFHGRYSDFSQFFYTVVNGDYYLFREGIIYFISISRHLSTHCNH